MLGVLLVFPFLNICKNCQALNCGPTSQWCAWQLIRFEMEEIMGHYLLIRFDINALLRVLPFGVLIR